MCGVNEPNRDRVGALQDLSVSVRMARNDVSRLVFEAIRFEMSGELQQVMRLFQVLGKWAFVAFAAI